MIRLSRLADYGVVLACQMAVKADHCHNAFDLAGRTGLPAPTVSKLLAALARAGVLMSQRGAKGGYRLARAARRSPSPISSPPSTGRSRSPSASSMAPAPAMSNRCARRAAAGAASTTPCATP